MAGQPISSPIAQNARTFSWRCLRLLRKPSVMIAFHLGALPLLFIETTWLDWLLFPVFLTVRGLVITIGYHRYFSHRSFKTSRAGQFVLACMCCCNMQNGPLWWAAVHRHHHRYSDEPEDFHSPVQGGFFWGHVAWNFGKLEDPDWRRVRDLTRYPELVWLERFHLVPPLLLAFVCWLIGGWSCLCLDFFLTAVVVQQVTWAVNSIGHLVGSRRYATSDSSRNSFLMALISMGDGWHNNHHHYPHSAQAGFFWWETDTSYLVIRLLAFVGLVWDVRGVPPHKLHPPKVEESFTTSAGAAQSGPG